jgi:hypothetical protein
VIVDNPQTKAEVEAQFTAYERGPLSSDVDTLRSVLSREQRCDRRQPEKMQIVSYGRNWAGAATLFNWAAHRARTEIDRQWGSSPLISASLTSLER